MVPPGQPIPDADMIVLAGSKATIADLAFVRAQGWDIDIRAHHRRGRPVLGLCGGYQMLGRSIADPEGLEGPAGSVEGLGLLDVATMLSPAKTLDRVAGTAIGARFEGYEIHIGTTTGPDTTRPLTTRDDGRSEGAISPDGLVAGSYVHGLFGLAAQRRAWLARLGVDAVGPDHAAAIDSALDSIAETLERHVAIDALIALSKTAGDRQRE